MPLTEESYCKARCDKSQICVAISVFVPSKCAAFLRMTSPKSHKRRRQNKSAEAGFILQSGAWALFQSRVLIGRGRKPREPQFKQKITFNFRVAQFQNAVAKIIEKFACGVWFGHGAPLFVARFCVVKRADAGCNSAPAPNRLRAIFFQRKTFILLSAAALFRVLKFPADEK